MDQDLLSDPVGFLTDPVILSVFATMAILLGIYWVMDRRNAPDRWHPALRKMADLNGWQFQHFNDASYHGMTTRITSEDEGWTMTMRYRPGEKRDNQIREAILDTLFEIPATSPDTASARNVGPDRLAVLMPDQPSQTMQALRSAVDQNGHIGDAYRLILKGTIWLGPRMARLRLVEHPARGVLFVSAGAEDDLKGLRKLPELTRLYARKSSEQPTLWRDHTGLTLANQRPFQQASHITTFIKAGRAIAERAHGQP